MAKPFHFQQFVVCQSREVFKVGTDGVLLGVLCSCKNAQRILEVGTGTGLISLMLAQRNPDAVILALDIDENAVHLAQKNFENAAFKDRLSVQHEDYKTFSTKEKFDVIVSNPPYFEETPDSQKNILARQQIELNFEELITRSSLHLSPKGVFSVIIPFASEAYFIEVCHSRELYLQRRIKIRGIREGVVKRLVLEFSFEPKAIVEEEIILERAPRVYSRQYLELTQEFHVFKNQ